MQSAKIPENEDKRLEILHKYDILDTAPEKRFDEITKLAAQICDVPIVFMSLIDSDRQWSKSTFGVEPSTSTPREVAFCAHTILDTEKHFIVQDTLKDERFFDNPSVVGEPYIRFYAGYPVVSGGEAIGTLCIVDKKPRSLSEMQKDALKVLAGQIVAQIELTHSLQTSMDEEGYIKAILDTTLDGLITINDRGIIQTFNPAAKKIFGYSDEEVIGKNINILMPEPYHSQHDGYIKKYRETKERKVIGIGREVKGKRKNGEIFPMELGVSEMEISGKTMFVGTVHDITERKQAEKIKDEFVSIISHELRTPLTSIRGSLGLIFNNKGQYSAEKSKDLLKIAHNNCERLVFLVNDILDVEKIASGKMKFNMKLGSISQMTQGMIKDNIAYAEKYNVSIDFKPIDEDVMIEVDEARYAQILSNLISNAAKFSEDGGVVEVSLEQYDDNVYVIVTDHGEGIPKEFQDKIFGKFLQSDSSSSRNKDGTGLGLYITKEMVEKMNGAIGFESEPGEGTTFWVGFPAFYSKRESNVKFQDDFLHDVRSRSDSDIPEILHVEDNVDLSRLLAISLGDEVKVINAKTLAQARQFMSQRNFDAIILDVSLPDGSGLNLLNDLKVKNDKSPVLVLSAHDVPDKLKNEVHDIIVKSQTSEEEIVEVILYMIDKK